MPLRRRNPLPFHCAHATTPGNGSLADTHGGAGACAETNASAVMGALKERFNVLPEFAALNVTPQCKHRFDAGLVPFAQLRPGF